MKRIRQTLQRRKATVKRRTRARKIERYGARVHRQYMNRDAPMVALAKRVVRARQMRAGS